jgi:hypothetical protein
MIFLHIKTHYKFNPELEKTYITNDDLSKKLYHVREIMLEIL